MPGIFAIIGVVLLAVAGANAGGPRFSPGWLGLALIALAVLWAPITAVAG